MGLLLPHPRWVAATCCSIRTGFMRHGLLTRPEVSFDQLPCRKRREHQCTSPPFSHPPWLQQVVASSTAQPSQQPAHKAAATYRDPAPNRKLVPSARCKNAAPSDDTAGQSSSVDCQQHTTPGSKAAGDMPLYRSKISRRHQVRVTRAPLSMQCSNPLCPPKPHMTVIPITTAVLCLAFVLVWRHLQACFFS